MNDWEIKELRNRAETAEAALEKFMDFLLATTHTHAEVESIVNLVRSLRGTDTDD